MILVIITLLAGFALADGSAADYFFSGLMCDILGISGSECSLKTLVTSKNKYCESDKSFFTEAELEKFIDEVKSNNSTIQNVLDIWNEGLSYFSELDGIFDKCGSKCSEVKKYFDMVKDLLQTLCNFNIDTNKFAYSASNLFNLGIMCLAADPNEFYDNDGVALIRDNVIDSLISYCINGIDMMQTYIGNLIDNINDLAGKSLISKEKMEDLIDSLDRDKVCKEAAHNVTLSSKLYKRIGETLFEIFYSTLKDIINGLKYINDEDFDINDYLDFELDLDFDIKEKIDELKDFISEFIESIGLSKYITNEDNDHIRYSNKGFDVVKSSMKNPEYEKMVKENLPSGVDISIIDDDLPSDEDSLPSSKSSGIAWWIILITVLAIIIIAVIVVSLVIYFVVVKPNKKIEEKREKQKEKEKEEKSEIEDVTEEDIYSIKSKTSEESSTESSSNSSK